MTFGEVSMQLPDGEELVVVDDSDDSPVPGRDPREASLDLRRRVVDPTLAVYRQPTQSTS
jgi:hypothetical protein